MYGNLYFVGHSKVSVHIIDTGEGLIMIDTGYPEMYDQILDSMNTLGLDPKNICAIFHSHGHIDHFGCTTRLKELSGAKTYISRIDNDILNGKLDLSWAKELGYERLPFFDCDVLVEDGDCFKFGNTTVRCVLTPGHTDGVLSFFVNVEDGDESIIASMHGGTILFITALLIVFLFRENPKGKENSKIVVEKKKSRAQSWEGLEFNKLKKTVYFYLAAFSVMMTGLVLQAINGVSITHMKDVGLSASYVMLVSSIHSITLTGFKFLTGVLYDKYGLRITTLICDITAVAVMIAIAAVTNSAFGMFFAMFYGIFSSLALPLETVLIPIIAGDLFGQKSYNQMIGIFSALNSIGYAIGSPLANVSFDKLGTYKPMFIVCCIIMIAIVFIFQLSITMAYKKRNTIIASQEEVKS